MINLIKHAFFVIVVLVLINPSLVPVRAQDPDIIMVVEWSPDGTMLLSAGTNGFLEVKDKDGTVLLNISGLSGDIEAIAWSPDGSKIAAADETKDIFVWNINESEFDQGELIVTFSGHEVKPTTLAWSPDGTRLASAAFQESLYAIRTWDVIDFTQEPLGIQRTALVHDLAWSPTSDKIAAATSTGVLVFDATLNIFPGAVAEDYRLGLHGTAFSVDWSPDGKQIAAAYHAKVPTASTDNPGTLIVTEYNSIIVYSVDTSSEILRIEAHSDFILDIAWDPAGTRLASLSLDGFVRIWETGTGKQLVEYSEANMLARSVSWQPDGSSVTYSGERGSIVTREFSFEGKDQ